MADNPKSLASLEQKIMSGLDTLAYNLRVFAKMYNSAIIECHAETAECIATSFAELRAPTIAAPSPSGKSVLETIEEYRLEHPGKIEAAEAELEAEGALDDMMQPSPSNEVTPEMKDAAVERAYSARLWSEAPRIPFRKGWEAALKARKPADDGAGQ